MIKSCFSFLIISIAAFLFAGCYNRETKVDKSHLLGYDYRLYQNSIAWELAKAVEDEDIKKIQIEVARDKSLLKFQEPRFGTTLLQMAVRTKKYRSAESLAQLGADPNLQNTYEGHSSLMEAAAIGFGLLQTGRDTRYLKLLLGHRGNPNTESHGGTRAEGIKGDTPLSIACLNGSLAYVKILVEAGANVNHIRNNGYDALCNAAIQKYPDIVLYLLNHGAIYKCPLSTDYDGTKEYIADLIRDWDFEKGSERFKTQLKIIAFLRKNGEKI